MFGQAVALDERPVTEDEIKEALTDYARTAAKMPTRSGLGWLNDQHSRIHERINYLLDQLGL